MKICAALLVAIGCLLGRVAFGSTELVTNGGFEALDASSVAARDSTAVGSGGVQSRHSTQREQLSFAGNINGPTNEAVFQTITFRPTRWWRDSPISGDAPSAAGPGRSLMCSKPSFNTTAPRLLLDHQVSANTGYQQATFDLTTYAGKTVLLGYAM